MTARHRAGLTFRAWWTAFVRRYLIDVDPEPELSRLDWVDREVQRMAREARS